MAFLHITRPVQALVVAVFILTFLIAPYRSLDHLWHSQNAITLGQLDYPLLVDVSNETLGFEKIFVINLPSRTDHRDSMALAAHFTGLDIEYVDGVTNVKSKALPPHPSDFDLKRPAIGAWRAHMNIARKIVEQNISTALILEDDSDWDLRLKSQMQDFARASRVLLQPRLAALDGKQYTDPTNPRTSTDERPENLELSAGGDTVEPTTSPYGDTDRWDVLWLGHCGTRFPQPEESSIPLGRVVFPDETVPEPHHIKLQFGTDELATQYPNHTRAVHRASRSVCTLGYAVTLAAARRMLYEFGVSKLSGPMDLMLSAMCEGTDGRRMATCLSVQPQIFQHHRRVGPTAAYSDISPHDKGHNPTAFTQNIRWSTQVNLPKLVNGETSYIDTFPDGAEAVNYLISRR